MIGGCEALRRMPAPHPLPPSPTQDTMVKTLDTILPPSPTRPQYHAAYDFIYLMEGPSDKLDRNSMRSIEVFRGGVVAAEVLKDCGLSLRMRLASNLEWAGLSSDSSVLFGPFWRTAPIVDSICRSVGCKQVVGGQVAFDTVGGEMLRIVITPLPAMLGAVVAQRIDRRYSHWRVVVMLDRTDSTRLPYFEQWLAGFKTAATQFGLQWDVRYLSPREVSWRRVGLRLRPTTSDSHVVVVLAVNPEFVTGILSYLVEKTTKVNKAKLGQDTVLPVVAVGLPQWQRFAHVEPEIWNRLKVEIATTYYVDYHRPDVQRFVKAYRKRFATEPSPYAFWGFDATLLIGKVLRRGGAKWDHTFPAFGIPMLSTQSRFERLPQGWVNRHVWVLKFLNYRWYPLDSRF